MPMLEWHSFAWRCLPKPYRQARHANRCTHSSLEKLLAIIITVECNILAFVCVDKTGTLARCITPAAAVTTERSDIDQAVSQVCTGSKSFISSCAALPLRITIYIANRHRELAFANNSFSGCSRCSHSYSNYVGAPNEASI